MNTKAIAVYLDDSDKMEVEFSWLYKTWILYSLDKEYDLVVYYNPPAEHRLEKFPGIIALPVPYIRLSQKYRFLNSHYFCQKEYCEPLLKYEHLMKTDCDVFLTRHLRGYVPSKVLIGEGGYYDPSDIKKVDFIRNLSSKFGLIYRSIPVVGASYFGKTKTVLTIVSNQATLTEHILTGCFDKEGYNKESGFHVGISSMIAGEIVVNHCLSHQHMNLYTLDSKCWETTKIGSDVLHIHAWHTNEKWSKHAFFRDEYKDWKVSFHEAFDNAANYCQWVATTPIEEIKKLREALA